MVTYKYTAMSPDGAKVNGVVDAIDEYAAVASIKQKCPVVLKITPVRESGDSWLNKDLSTKVDPRALSLMCSQFATILGAGVNVAQAMEMIGKQTEDKKLKEMLLKSAQDVSQGNSIATSMQKNCPQLPLTFVETIRAGEQSGTLEDSFKNLETYYKKNYMLKEKVRQALSYPVFVVCVAIVVLIIVMTKVMPTITDVFADLGGELPAMTRIMISMSNWFSRWWILLVGIIAAAVVLFTVWKRSESGKKIWSRHQLHSKVMGKIHTYSVCADFANTMAALLAAGLPVTNALEITSKVLDNYTFSLSTRALVGKVEQGIKLGDAMRADEVFPSNLTEMTAVGENTGEMEKTLNTTGEYYTNEANVAMEAAISKLEPTMLILLAVFAGFIVISIYLPMFTMYDLM